MYLVSNAFLEAVNAKTRKYYWTGRITTKGGTVYEFGKDDIVKGSGYITSQCCGNRELELGSVYAAEMGISLFSDIDRYTLMDGTVELFYHLRVSESGDADAGYGQTVEADGIYESVPMGIFEISEASRRVRCLEIKAYDYMLRFDKRFEPITDPGNAYDLMLLCSSECRVALAQERSVIEDLPNGSLQLSLYSDSDIETYRDVLYYVGQLLGGFFAVNRQGKLELRKYGSVPVVDIGRRHRYSSDFSDFVTRYTAVSSTNMRTEVAEYYALAPDDGLTMNLGINPFIQFGGRDSRESVVRNILADLSTAVYVPFSSETIGNPALDAGDIISFSGGHADPGSISCITYSCLKIGGKHRLRCVGKNPRLARAKSRNDKNISGLLAQVSAGRMGLHTFRNVSAFNVTDVDTKIISMEFSTVEMNNVQFLAQVIVDVRTEPFHMEAAASGSIFIPGPGGEDIEVHAELPVEWMEYGHVDAIFTFELNGRIITDHCPQERWDGGRHTILLYYPMENIEAYETNTINVYMRCYYGYVMIAAGSCIAAVSGQSMAAEGPWGGILEFSDEGVGPYVFGGSGSGRIRIGEFAETFGTEFMGTEIYGYSDIVERTGISSAGPFEVP